MHDPSKNRNAAEPPGYEFSAELPFSAHQVAHLPPDDLNRLATDYRRYQQDLARQAEQPHASRERAPEGTLDRLLLEESPDLVWHCTPAGGVTYCNRRWLEYTGQSLPQARGLGWIRAVHPADLIRLAGCLKAALSGEGRYEAEYRLRCAASGEYRWHLARGLLVRDAQGRPVGWVGSAVDIEAHKRDQFERDRRLKELKDLVARMKQTSDLLAICASCKKVRDEQANWLALDHYLAAHSSIRFTHGICPACLRKMFPDDADSVLGEDEL